MKVKTKFVQRFHSVFLSTALCVPTLLFAAIDEGVHEPLEKLSAMEASEEQFQEISTQYLSLYESKPIDSVEGLGRFASLRGYLLTHLRSDLDKAKGKQALAKCMELSQKLVIHEESASVSFAWYLSCAIQLFKISKDNNKEMATVLLGAANSLRSVVVLDQGEDWLDLRSTVRANQSEFPLLTSYHGGVLPRSLAEIYIQMESFFVTKSPLVQPLIIAMKEFIGGVSEEQVSKFRKQICQRAAHFAQIALDIDDSDNSLDRSGEEFLANYRVMAEVAKVCANTEKTAEEYLHEGMKMFESLQKDQLANSEDAAEAELLKNLVNQPENIAK